MSGFSTRAACRFRSVSKVSAKAQNSLENGTPLALTPIAKACQLYKYLISLASPTGFEPVLPT